MNACPVSNLDEISKIWEKSQFTSSDSNINACFFHPLFAKDVAMDQKHCKLFREFSRKEFLIRTCAYQGVRNVSFSENFAYVLNGWPLYIPFMINGNIVSIFY